MPKKVMLISNTTWSLWNYRKGLINYLTSKGYKVILVAPYDKYVRYLKGENIEYYSWNTQTYSNGILNEFKSFLHLLKLLYRIKPNIIFQYTAKSILHGIVASFLLNIPCISIFTGLGFFNYLKNSVKINSVISLYRLTGLLSKEVWFLNSHDRDLFINNKWLLPSKARIINGEGVDTDYFFFSPIQKQANPTFKFLFAGRLLWKKGLRELVEVASRIQVKYPNTEFWVLGISCPESPDAIPISQIEEWHNRGIIKYLGHADDIRPYLEQADAVFLPTYSEGLSRFLLEAASMGRPILTSNLPGCQEVVIDGKSGYVFNIQNLDSIYNSIEKYILLPHTDKCQMGQESRNIAISYFKDSIIFKEYLKSINRF